MRYIDAFNHFNPKRYFDELLLSPSGQKDIGKRVRGIPALYDLDLRKKVVEQFPDYTQVLSLGLPMIERLAIRGLLFRMHVRADLGVGRLCRLQELRPRRGETRRVALVILHVPSAPRRSNPVRRLICRRMNALYWMNSMVAFIAWLAGTMIRLPCWVTPMIPPAARTLLTLASDVVRKVRPAM